mgnify:CR=1 FL=1
MIFVVILFLCGIIRLRDLVIKMNIWTGLLIFLIIWLVVFVIIEIIIIRVREKKIYKEYEYLDTQFEESKACILESIGIIDRYNEAEADSLSKSYRDIKRSVISNKSLSDLLMMIDRISLSRKDSTSLSRNKEYKEMRDLLINYKDRINNSLDRYNVYVTNFNNKVFSLPTYLVSFFLRILPYSELTIDKE